MSASVVSGVDASPILEAGEHVLDLVALAVEDGIVGVLDAVPGMGRDARGDTLIGQRLSEGGGAIGPVGEQEAGEWQMIKDRGRGLVIIGLTFGQMQQQRAPSVIANHLQLGGQAASAASDTSG